MGTAGWRGVLGGVVLLLPAGAVVAAGFAVREQSVSAQGNAFAGATAGAEDVATWPSIRRPSGGWMGIDWRSR